MRRGFIPDKAEKLKQQKQASGGKPADSGANKKASLSSSGGVDGLAAMADDLNNLNDVYQQAAPQIERLSSRGS